MLDNPHFIPRSNIADTAGATHAHVHLDDLSNLPRVQTMKAHLAEFVSAYREVCDLIPKSLQPYFAYRLDPITEPMTDDLLDVEKFGGIPNFWRDYDYRALGNEAGWPSAEEYVRWCWPRCRCCQAPLRFVGQIHGDGWLQAIHELTARSHCSGVGNYRTLGPNFPFARTWLTIFICDENHYDFPIPDAECIFELEWLGLGSDPKPHDRVPPWSRDELTAATGAFARRHGVLEENDLVSAIPLLKVVDWHLGFDVDTELSKRDISLRMRDRLTRFRRGEVETDVQRRLRSPSGFQFFGAPQSQQIPRRYLCINGYQPHRQSPIISWTDEGRDVTRQIYGCMACEPFESRSLFAKTDISRT